MIWAHEVAEYGRGMDSINGEIGTGLCIGDMVRGERHAVLCKDSFASLNFHSMSRK